MLVLSILGWLTLALGIGIVFLAIVGVWVIVDLFLIPGMIDAHKSAARVRISTEVSAQAARAS